MSNGVGSLPKVFIGSSTEQLEIAETIQLALDYECEPTVWSQGIFRPTRSTLSELTRAANTFDFAIFVFAPDDLLSMRGTSKSSVRDNVVFELGLFMGALEPERCFIMLPRGGESLHLPSDLLGIAPVTYNAGRSDENLEAALAPGCLRIRRTIRAFKAAPKRRDAVSALAKPVRTLEKFVAEWNAAEMQAAREQCRELPFDQYDEEFQAKRPFLKRIFVFLNELAGAILANEIDEHGARAVFERAVSSTWALAHTMLAPVNHADEWWDPPPDLAKLSARWARSEPS